MKISVIGTGYVGLVAGVCLAEIGHEVHCVDLDQQKIALLKDAVLPIFEPGLEKPLRTALDEGRLFFTTELSSALADKECVFIAVGTPPRADGSADLTAVFAAAKQIAQLVERDLTIIVKSTVPVGTCAEVQRIVDSVLKERSLAIKISVASNPEFLKEGNAYSDFMKPDRIIVGVDNEAARDVFERLYRCFVKDDPSKLIFMETRSSEMTKYVANAMLALRISFMNEMAILAEALGADVDQVRVGIGTDARIGKKFLYPGPGFGGSCFPKDLSSLLSFGHDHGVELKLVGETIKVNERQKVYAAEKIKRHFGSLQGKKIAVWGLAFKPQTDDVRDAPALAVIKNLLAWGATVVAHDPEGIENFDLAIGPQVALSYKQGAYEVLAEADALVLLTEWSEYKWPNWTRVKTMMRGTAVFDFRNQYDPVVIAPTGMQCYGIGRGSEGRV
jgi:UDPglucose 6-dehydrogenase